MLMQFVHRRDDRLYRGEAQPSGQSAVRVQRFMPPEGLPAGCVAPLAFDDAAAKALRAGKALKLTVIRSDNNEPFALSVSLDGFGSAMDRTSALAE